jgi:hypothetical protein
VYLNESPSSDFIASEGIQRQERQDPSATVHYRDPVIGGPASGPMTSAIDAVR